MPFAHASSPARPSIDPELMIRMLIAETSEAAMTSRGLLDDDDLTKANPSEDSRPSRGISDA
jgi:hypothetical protein